MAAAGTDGLIVMVAPLVPVLDAGVDDVEEEESFLPVPSARTDGRHGVLSTTASSSAASPPTPEKFREIREMKREVAARGRNGEARVWEEGSGACFMPWGREEQVARGPRGGAPCRTTAFGEEMR